MTTAKPGALQGFDEGWADVKGVRMRYFVAGSGPPLVLVHGLSGAAANWSELAPRLAERRRVLVPDLPGHGGSSPLPAAPSLTAYAERVRLVAEQEGMLPAAVVGHSMGAVVALRLAVTRPEAVAALVLAGAAGIASSTRRAQLIVGALGVLRPSRIVAPLRRSVAQSRLLRHAVFGRIEVADARSLTPAAVEGLLGAARHHTDVRSAGSVLVRDDPRLDLERVRCPSLVLWGGSDLQVPIADAFEYARRLRAPLRTIADCGHLLIAERPESCAHAIDGFLDRLEL